MWQYIEYSFVPSLHPGNTRYIADDANVLVGVARIRQLRVVPGTAGRKHSFILIVLKLCCYPCYAILLHVQGNDINMYLHKAACEYRVSESE